MHPPHNTCARCECVALQAPGALWLQRHAMPCQADQPIRGAADAAPSTTQSPKGLRRVMHQLHQASLCARACVCVGPFRGLGGSGVYTVCGQVCNRGCVFLSRVACLVLVLVAPTAATRGLFLQVCSPAGQRAVLCSRLPACRARPSTNARPYLLHGMRLLLVVTSLECFSPPGGRAHLGGAAWGLLEHPRSSSTLSRATNALTTLAPSYLCVCALPPILVSMWRPGVYIL